MATISPTHSPAQSHTVPQADVDAPALVGVMAEYADVDSLMRAAKQVKAAGYTRWDVHSPFPIHGIDDVIGIKPTKLPWMVLGGGLFGMAAGTFLTIYTQSTSFEFMGLLAGYEYLISGKPLVSFPAFVPIIFETTVLGAALTAVFGMLGLNRLPMLYHPLLKSARFRRATDDRFFIVIDATDPSFDETKTAEMLGGTRTEGVERVED
ncbi:MAG: DUF3341 domain-containing protein [Phycisphaerae bacterium]